LKSCCCRHHPDISEEPSAEQDFLRIQEAYEVLTNKRDAAQADPKNNGWDFHDWYTAALNCLLLDQVHQYAQGLQPDERHLRVKIVKLQRKVEHWSNVLKQLAMQRSLDLMFICCRYWDFTMSRRWDSHWKKQGKSGPSPFASTPTHRKQWQAQLGRLKQKAAFRRSQQQASQQVHPAEDQWAQHQDVRQQWYPQPADGLHGSQQDAHQQDLCHEDVCQPQHRIFNADAEPDNAVQDHANNLENAPGQERSNHGPGAATLSSYPIGAVPTDHQRHAQSPQPADTLQEATQTLLSQVQSCHLQLTHNLSLRTSHWPNQVNELLCYALEQPGLAHAANQSSHSADVPQDLPTIQSSSVSAASAFSDAPADDVADVKGSAASLHSTEAGKASVADQTEDTKDASSHDLPKDGEADAAENCTGSQAAFQTQHSQIQSQLAGLRRRAVRKQDG